MRTERRPATEKLNASYKTLLLRLLPALVGLGLVVGWRSGDWGDALILAGVCFLFGMALAPRALILDEVGVRRVQLLPLWRFRKVRWEDVQRFFPSKTGGWPFVSYELLPGRRRFRVFFWKKEDGSFPPLFGDGHWVPALRADDLAELLNARRKLSQAGGRATPG